MAVVLDERGELVDSELELLLACREDEERSTPPAPLLSTVGLGVADALPEAEASVGVARTCTLVLVEPQT